VCRLIAEQDPGRRGWESGGAGVCAEGLDDFKATEAAAPLQRREHARWAVMDGVWHGAAAEPSWVHDSAVRRRYHPVVR